MAPTNQQLPPPADAPTVTTPLVSAVALAYKYAISYCNHIGDGTKERS
jgi:hypothetical protein